MKKSLERAKYSIAERLLHMRAQAGEDAGRHARYHRLVNRYQRFLLRRFLRTDRPRWRRLGAALVAPALRGWHRLRRRLGRLNRPRPNWRHA